MKASVFPYHPFLSLEKTPLTQPELLDLVAWLIKLQQRVAQQHRLLEEQRWQIEEQNKRIEILADEIDCLRSDSSKRTLFSSSLEPKHTEDFPTELLEFSSKAEIKKEQAGRKRSSISYRDYSNNSASLMPLHERDIQALRQLFEGKDLEAIADNINEVLLVLFPEPCWDENGFEFLEEFL